MLGGQILARIARHLRLEEGATAALHRPLVAKGVKRDLFRTLPGRRSFVAHLGQARVALSLFSSEG